jgi:hypothetical protein
MTSYGKVYGYKQEYKKRFLSVKKAVAPGEGGSERAFRSVQRVRSRRSSEAIWCLRRSAMGRFLALFVFAVSLCTVIPTALLGSTNGCPAPMEKRVYSERAQGKEFVNTYAITEGPSEYHVTIVSLSTDGRPRITKQLHLDKNYATLEWVYRDYLEGIDLHAVREGNTIRLEGKNRGREVKKTYTIDSLPWRQQFPLDLERFVKSDQDKELFWSIGTNDPADMKIAKFVARKEGGDVVSVNGSNIPVIRVHITFAGALSIVWKADAWHRDDDGEFVRFNSGKAPGYPMTVVEMVSEKR